MGKSSQRGNIVIGFFFSLFFINRLSTDKCMILMRKREVGFRRIFDQSFRIHVGAEADH